MNKIEKIKAEIKRLKNELIQEAEKGYKSEFDEGRIAAFEDMITFIDSLEEEPVSNNLEEAANEYGFANPVIHYEADGNTYDDTDKPSFDFIAGAQWQKEQLMKNLTFMNEVEWEDDIHKLFREKGKKVKLMIVEEE